VCNLKDWWCPGRTMTDPCAGYSAPPRTGGARGDSLHVQCRVHGDLELVGKRDDPCAGNLKLACWE